ncbi:MAG: acyl--CoA ligase [Proteobacteria bacterium]|uniref:Acyl--CoA ligase n=1 Tax=Candidatus Avisuccinivibrio stercorigallinarum TaxID=2840704 RepID=A0A9D9GMX4_9GAMM|nr:acyl--CoA ligase [Candidatus Avisuccinivibrio stercorigallinarum]
MFRGESGDITAGVVRLGTVELIKKLQAFEGSRVAITAVDRASFVLALLAVAYAGKSAVLLPYRDAAYLNLKKQYFDLVLTDKLYPAEDADFVQLQAEIPQCQNGSCDLGIALADLPYLDLNTKVYLFTSGTSGEPKIVEKTLSFMQEESRILYGIFGDKIAGRDFISSVHPQHLYGLTFGVFLPLCSGAAIERALIRDAAALSQLPPFERGHVLVSSPGLFKRIDFRTKAQDFAFITSGTVELTQDLADKVMDWAGCNIFECYGSTESGVMGYRLRRDKKSRFTPLPGVSFFMGQVSYILHSPIITGGQLILSDMLEFYGDGTFKPCGRFDNIIKIDEQRVSINELTSQLRSFDEVDDAEVLVLPPEEVPTIGAVVVLKEGLKESDTIDSIKERIALNLGDKAVPQRFVFVPEIPENKMGKRLRFRLQALFDE